MRRKSFSHGSEAKGSRNRNGDARTVTTTTLALTMTMLKTMVMRGTAESGQNASQQKASSDCCSDNMHVNVQWCQRPHMLRKGADEHALASECVSLATSLPSCDEAVRHALTLIIMYNDLYSRQ